MTVPTDSLSSHGPAGAKVRPPLSSLPMPMLPSDPQLKAHSNHPTQRNTRPSANVNSNASGSQHQNSLLSSWLSNANNGGGGGHNRGSSNPSSGQIDRGMSQLMDGKDESSHHPEESDMGSNAESERMDVDEPHHHHQQEQPHASSAHEEDPSASPSPSPAKGKRGRKPKSNPEASDVVPKAPKEPKEKKIKEPKQPKEPKPKKSAIANTGEEASSLPSTGGQSPAVNGNKSDRSILSFFDRSKSTPSKGTTAQHIEVSLIIQK
jgi:hypothetical protein